MKMTFQGQEQLAVLNPIKASGLSGFWLNRVASICSINQTLNAAEHGQLKWLKESLGFERAKEVIEYTLREWDRFVTTAEHNAGAIALPAKPNVGFLVKYRDFALSMTQEHLQLIAQKKAHEQQVQALPAAEANMIRPMQKPPMAIIQLGKDHVNAFLNADELYDDFFAAISAKYGEWRPAKWDEKGIPCDIELKIAV